MALLLLERSPALRDFLTFVEQTTFQLAGQRLMHDNHLMNENGLQRNILEDVREVGVVELRS